MANIKYTQTAEQKRRGDKKSQSSLASGAKDGATNAGNASGAQGWPTAKSKAQ
jgi:hypothetical protein